jgi:C4-dicarboxylate transporter DctQ subunit
MNQLLRAIHRGEDALLVIILLVMIVLAGVDIIARLLFGGGISWVPPFLRVLVLWLGLLGALLATRSREHIAIDLASRLGGPALKRVLAIVTTVFAAGVCGLIAWHSSLFVQLAYEFGDVAFNRVPAWPLQLIIPISFGLMAIRFGLQAGLAALDKLPEADQ